VARELGLGIWGRAIRSLAIIASIRHRHTNYDEILMETADRPGARAQVRDKINQVLNAWGPAET
jgi:hypothetical protein